MRCNDMHIFPSRQYQAANLSVNLFFVDSQFAFNYAWCVGARSVTTNNCKQLSALSENRFYQVFCLDLKTGFTSYYA